MFCAEQKSRTFAPGDNTSFLSAWPSSGAFPMAQSDAQNEISLRFPAQSEAWTMQFWFFCFMRRYTQTQRDSRWASLLMQIKWWNSGYSDGNRAGQEQDGQEFKCRQQLFHRPPHPSEQMLKEVDVASLPFMVRFHSLQGSHFTIVSCNPEVGLQKLIQVGWNIKMLQTNGGNEPCMKTDFGSGHPSSYLTKSSHLQMQMLQIYRSGVLHWRKSDHLGTEGADYHAEVKLISQYVQCYPTTIVSTNRCCVFQL